MKNEIGNIQIALQDGVNQSPSPGKLIDERKISNNPPRIIQYKKYILNNDDTFAILKTVMILSKLN